MQLTYTPSGDISVTIDAETQSEAFEELASFQEVFNTRHVIKGKEVDPKDIRFLVRTDTEENKYYELVYRGSDKELWGYKFPFGSNKKGGGLFPRRKLDTQKATHEQELPNYDWESSGWRKWKGEKQGKGNSGEKAGDGKAPF